MVYVRLDGEWTDGKGISHSAGDMVDVDAATLATLQAKGLVSENKADWVGPTGSEPTTNWVGPTSTEP